MAFHKNNTAATSTEMHALLLLRTFNLVRFQFADKFPVDLNDRVLRFLVDFEHQLRRYRTLSRRVHILNSDLVELVSETQHNTRSDEVEVACHFIGSLKLQHYQS